MIISEEAYLAHYGTLRRSGRYPWGSGEDPKTMHSGGFSNIVKDLRNEGFTDTQIAKGFGMIDEDTGKPGMATTKLRELLSIESNEKKQAKISQAVKLTNKGMSPNEVAKRMGLPNESSVRSLIAASKRDESNTIQTISSMLKGEVDKDGSYIQVGKGVENILGIPANRLSTAVAILEEKGYKRHSVQVDQIGQKTKTTVKVITPPGTTYRDAVAHPEKIRMVSGYSVDGGRTFNESKPPLNLSSKRVQIKYAEEGGDKADGMIYVRPGVHDTRLDGSSYAQVRIAVDKTHYIKGMAVYKKDLPEGVDVQFNTSKSNTGNKHDAMKTMEKNLDGSVNLNNPFGSQIRRQIFGDDPNKPNSVMNILDEEGTWGEWNKAISTQVLSKQPPLLAKQQLDMTYENKREDLVAIKALTNPAVRRRLLAAFADGADSSAVHLEAAHLPRQATQVILPMSTLKKTEIYAPNYRPGELVALVRYPHGGRFEIPELIVNNKHKPAIDLFGTHPKDMVAIHPEVAKQLSGADFDGDTVVVFPNNKRQLIADPALKGLKGFDPHGEYQPYDGMRTMAGGTWDAKTKKQVFPPGKKPNGKNKGTEMGKISNLITDMTILGASNEELVRAVKHSMVVIDAEKHFLDYRRSSVDRSIQALHKKYQGKAGGSAATLISRATSKTEIDQTSPRRAKDGGPIDRQTGELRRIPKTFTNRFGETVSKKIEVDKLAATTDAFTLVSDKKTKIESVYAVHSNRLKQLANDARKEVAAFKPPLMSKPAQKAFKPQVDSLLVKLNKALRNSPLERQAQLVANAMVKQKLEDNPLIDHSDLKKIEHQALATARNRVGASKHKIIPTQEEWAAIQAGAISQNHLKQILDNADLDAIRTLATPRTHKLMTSTKTARAKAMIANGYGLQEVADQLGVSLTTLNKSI